MRGHICQYPDCESTNTTISLNYRNESRPHFCTNEHAALWLLRAAWGRDSPRYRQARDLIERRAPIEAPKPPGTPTVTSPSPKPAPSSHVEVTVRQAEFEGDYGMIAGLIITCTRCNSEITVYGQQEKSIRRGMVMLRDNCPEGPIHFYKVQPDTDPTILGAG